jgi:hypothetical protein
MNGLKQVKEEHISALAPEFPDLAVAQLRHAQRAATLDRDRAITALLILPIKRICLHWIL